MGKAAYPSGTDVKLRIAATGLLTDQQAATTTTNAVSAGSSVSIPAGSSAGFQIGDTALIDGDANAELAVVTAIADATHLTATLANSHTAGAGIARTLFGAAPFAAVDWTLKASVGRMEFETAVGRTMLAVTQTRTFDAPPIPKTVLDLKTDLAALTSLSVNGTAKVLNTDYFLGPANADADGEPWSWIEFTTYLTGSLPQRCIAITGLWGYAAAIPEDAWNAMLARAALECYPELALTVSKGRLRRQEGDVSEDYARTLGTSPLAAESAGWKATFDAGVQQYRRATVGI